MIKNIFGIEDMMVNLDKRFTDANNKVIKRIQSSQVQLCGIDMAKNKLLFLQEGRCLLHSGPPAEWENMCGAMRNAVFGALVYEGWVRNLKEAQNMAESGLIRFGSANEHMAVGPMAGIISPSMPVFWFKNSTFGNESFVTINEGLGKTLRFGANDDMVIDRLVWIQNELAPILREAIEMSGPIDLTSIISRGIQRGDECHNRNKASTGLFIRKIAPWLVRTSAPREAIAKVMEFLDGNDHFFLNLSMGVSKATMDATLGVDNSTIVSCMSTNGYEFGIRVAGTGNTWFKSTAPYAQGNYFPQYSEADASTAMGDSYISETAGIGAFAMGASPGIGRFIGIDTQQGLDFSLNMYKITVAEHSRFKIPALDFRGTPLGIDIRKVVDSGILPIINTGIAHKNPGVGQIGAGIVYPPIKCFQKAVEAL